MGKAIVFLFLCALCVPAYASASLARITEIMYDPAGADTGKEWLEIQNTAAAPIDLSTWRLYEANTNHKIFAGSISDGSGTAQSVVVPAGGFAVIASDLAKFAADNPGFSGALFKGSFSLGNSGEPLIIRDDAGADVDSVTYDPAIGAAGDGNSLQRTQTGGWIAALPTAGAPTMATASVVPSSIDTESSGAGSAAVNLPSSSASGSSAASSSIDPTAISAHSRQEEANTSADLPEFEMTIGRPRLGFAGSFLPFEAKVAPVSRSNSASITGDVSARESTIQTIWSMGDGARMVGRIVSYAYRVPGDYVVVANSSYRDDRGGAAYAVSRVPVHIVAPDLYLSDVTNGIDIINAGGVEANIGGFMLVVNDDKGDKKGGGRSNRKFIIPDDTLIEPHRGVVISTDISRIDSRSIASGALELFDALGREVGKVDSSPPAIIALPAGFDPARFGEAFRQFLQASLEK